MSLKLNKPHNIRGVVSYKRSFPDLNDAHLEVAKKIGISPLADREEAEAMKEKLTHITDNEFYAVDSLTHSIPYLVPRASALLDTIGSNFLDSLAAKGLNPNQVIITSVLRTATTRPAWIKAARTLSKQLPDGCLSVCRPAAALSTIKW